MKEITNLRMSITNRCNLSCAYCHKEGNPISEKDNKYKEMSLDEIRERLKAVSEIGIKDIKITGGEPLIRTDITEIIQSAKEYGFNDISLTTNGILLAQIAKKLKDAGLTRINIGCDSLSTGVAKNTKTVYEGIIAAKNAGFEFIKLNMLILKDINDNEVDNMILFAKETGCILQLIELIPLNVSKEFYNAHHMPLTSIEEKLKQKAKLIATRDMQNRSIYEWSDANGTAIVEVVGPSNEHFCENCKKIRITADGMIKPCIMTNNNLVEFKDKESILNAINKKKIYNNNSKSIDISNMVDVSEKPQIQRIAVASGKIFLKEDTIEKIKNEQIKKGDVLEISKEVAITAVKQTQINSAILSYNSN